MEKTSSLNDVINFSNLPSEIQQKIAAYLDTPALCFFAQINKQILENVLPLLHKHQALLSLCITAKANNTYLYQANQLFVCGDNHYGQLGLGDKMNRSTFTAVPLAAEQGEIQQVSVGGFHAIVLTRDNKIWACGYNAFGQLGLGDNMNRSTFTVVPWSAEQGQIKQVSAGAQHTIVLTQDSRLWVCGLNIYNQLGLIDQVHRLTFTAVPWPKERGRIEKVIAGGNHTLVLTQDNKLWVCGHNNCATFTATLWPQERGQIQQVVAGNSHTLVLTDANTLWMCGNNQFGQLGFGDKVDRFSFTEVLWPTERGQIEQIIAGWAYTLVLTQNNQLWVCGENNKGQLGLGDKKHRSTFTMMPWPNKRGRIEQIIAGGNHILMLTQENWLWACGNNHDGQLGLGDNKKSSIFKPVRKLWGQSRSLCLRIT